MVNVRLYQPKDKAAWDSWITQAKNGSFLFCRDYMEYHADRFKDHSLLFFEDKELLAVLPANRKGKVLYSHGGLTYGGIVSGASMRTVEMLALFTAFSEYLAAADIERVVYKRIPYIHHRLPADEDLFALFIYNAALTKRDVSSAVFVPNLKIPGNRLRGAKKCESTGVTIRQTNDFGPFMEMAAGRLKEKYDLSIVHSPEEIGMLAGRFPQNIRLFGAYRQSHLVAGALMYENPGVAHVQYLSANEEGKGVRALDLLLVHLLTSVYRGAWWFDFGISTEEGGRVLNETLFKQKEEFGCTALCYDAYEWQVGKRLRPLHRRVEGVVQSEIA